MANTPFQRRPLSELSLHDILLWADKADSGEPASYTSVELAAELVRRRQVRDAQERIRELTRQKIGAC